MAAGTLRFANVVVRSSQSSAKESRGHDVDAPIGVKAFERASPERSVVTGREASAVTRVIRGSLGAVIQPQVEGQMEPS